MTVSVYLSSSTKLHDFANISKSSTKKTYVHNKRSYVYYGKGDRLHGTCWKMFRLIAAIALFILSSLLIPLIFKFKSYKNLIEKLWKEGITGREKDLSIYIQAKSQKKPPSQPKALT